MTADLRECKKRIDWARQHIDALGVLNRQLLAKEEYEFLTDFDPSSGWWTFRLKAESVPPEISFMVGDVLHNLRSTLDHLVWQLTIANGNTPDSFPLARKSNWGKIQFPIADTPEGFAKSAASQLWGVSPECRDYIEGWQPYKTATQPGDVSILWVLRELSNVDKHRLPNVAVSWLHEYRLTEPMRSARTRMEVRTNQWPGPFTEATEIFGIRYDPIPELMPDIAIHAETDIAFDEDSGIGRGMPVVETLDKLESTVHSIVYGSNKLVGENLWRSP